MNDSGVKNDSVYHVAAIYHMTISIVLYFVSALESDFQPSKLQHDSLPMTDTTGVRPFPPNVSVNSMM